jgi:hypothetical protein
VNKLAQRHFLTLAVQVMAMAAADGVIAAADFIQLAEPHAYSSTSSESAGLPVVPQPRRPCHPDAGGTPQPAERLSDCPVRRPLVPYSSHNVRAFAQRVLMVLFAATTLGWLGALVAVLVAGPPSPALMLESVLHVGMILMVLHVWRHRLIPWECSWLLTDEQPGGFPAGLLRCFGGISRQDDVEQLTGNMQACGILRAKVRHGTHAIKSLEAPDMALPASSLHGGRKLTSAERLQDMPESLV